MSKSPILSFQMATGSFDFSTVSFLGDISDDMPIRTEVAVKVEPGEGSFASDMDVLNYQADSR